MTLTIKLPDDLEERLASLSEEERERFTVEALREKIEEDERDTQTSYSLTPEDLADIGAAFFGIHGCHYMAFGGVARFSRGLVREFAAAICHSLKSGIASPDRFVTPRL